LTKSELDRLDKKFSKFEKKQNNKEAKEESIVSVEFIKKLKNTVDSITLESLNTLDNNIKLPINELKEHLGNFISKFESNAVNSKVNFSLFNINSPNIIKSNDILLPKIIPNNSSKFVIKTEQKNEELSITNKPIIILILTYLIFNINKLNLID
jgi:hypothetical protein